jgi:hypothetical protein
MHPNLLENDSIMKTDAQEVEINEINLEQLEAIQGVSWLSKLLDKLEVKIEKWWKSGPTITIPFLKIKF